jgi:uncharacterized Zn finger protein
MNNDHPTPPSSGREELRIITACPMCMAAYHPLASRVIAQRGEHHLLYLECRQCGSAVVAFITADAGGVDSIGMLTDLTSDELLEIGHLPTITADDALDLHQWFNQSDTIQLTLGREKV